MFHGRNTSARFPDLIGVNRRISAESEVFIVQLSTVDRMKVRASFLNRGVTLALLPLFFLLLGPTLLAQGGASDTLQNNDPERIIDPIVDSLTEEALENTPPEDEQPPYVTNGPWQQIKPVYNGTVRITPQPKYDRGGLHRTFYGDLWRDLWGTEIEVPVLDLDKTGGGLTVEKKGGGKQTTSLRFMGADGREYKFRSIDKDPSSVLPRALQKTFVDNIMQDMISSQNPVGPLIAVPILDAVGIMNAHAYIVILPDHPRLGEFREEMAGMLGTLEEHPNEGPNETPGFYGETKIKGSDDMYDDLKDENTVQVDYIEYLKARLVDLIIGDWDRHMDQYRWAVRTRGNQEFLLPIPRDRDQAFTRYDGLIPWWAEEAFPEIEGTEAEYPAIEDLTWAGKTLDRRFLVPITRKSWDSLTRWVQSRVTDEVIERAARQMPKEFYEKEGDWLTSTLRTRRDNLQPASEELYMLVREEAELWGSEQDEYVAVDRIDDDHVRVSFFRRDKSGAKVGAPYLQHTFNRDETDEIRIMLLDGDDMAVVSGRVNSSITVRIDGGDGADSLIDNSKVDGYFFLTPIPDAETSTYFYDHGKKSAFSLGAGTRIDRREYEKWDEDTAAWRPPHRDYGSDWGLTPWLSYDSDAGIFTGLTATHNGYGFRQDPYAYSFTYGAGYAFGASAVKGKFEGVFRNWIPNAAVLIDFLGSELEIFNFYGLGNETTISELLDARDYYDVSQRQFVLSTDVKVPRDGTFSMLFGAEASYTRTQLEESPILEDIGEQFLGVQPTGLIAATTGIRIDSRDNVRVPTKGLFVDAAAKVYPTLWDNQETFSNVRVEARTYLTASILTLALRGVTEQVFGEKYPFYESAYLGGRNSLRSYEGNRFAGDASLFGNAELRMHLFNFQLISRNKLGLIGFSEAGRVYIDEEKSDTWHYGYGGGISVSFAKPQNLISATVGISDENEMRYVVNFGHLF